MTPKNDLHFLRYLAGIGATYVHPHSRWGTHLLIRALELRPGQRVLEIGCGSGATLVEIARRYRVEVVGIEILPEMLRAARRRIRWAGLSRTIWLIRGAPGQPLPMKNDAFDRVILESVLGIQDTPLLLEMLREIYRVLKKGGWMIANEAIWKPGISDEVVQRINQSCLRDFGVRLSSEHPWSVEEWKAAIESAGLAVVSCRRIAEYSPEMGKLPSPFRGKGPAFPLITALGRIKSFLSPVFIAARRRYAKSLKSHAEDGQYIEARLFIARKP